MQNFQRLSMADMHEVMLQESMTCRKGDALLEIGKYTEAKKAYWECVVKIVGTEYRIPGVAGSQEGGVRTALYTSINPYDRANLMGCCTGIAKCLTKEGDLESALEWFEEINLLYRNTYFANTEKPLYNWVDYNLDLPELTFRRVSGHAAMADVLVSLGNTGAALHRLWAAGTSYANMPDSHRSPRILSAANRDGIVGLCQLRHPDASLTAKMQVKDPALSMLGSWLKLPVKAPSSKVLHRYSFSSFIWKSRLYIGGGRHNGFGPFYRDLWCLDLNKLADGWRLLPSYPHPLQITGPWFNWHMHVYAAKAYLFTGRPRIDVFDLVTEKWSSIRTFYHPTAADRREGGVTEDWPWPGKQCGDTAQILTRDRLFVFGGQHGNTKIGCNLFMELDMKTKVWRRLSGYVMPPKDGDYSCPGPRKEPAIWTGKDKEKIYILYGQCDRNGAYLNGEPHGADYSFPYDDMWSWDLRTEKWTRERISGNSPCPRAEMAYTYNEKLDRVIIFGGYNPCIPSDFPSLSKQFEYSYFADTFLLTPPDPATPPPSTASLNGPKVPKYGPNKWKQVLTRGFPTYRCQAQLKCDPDTGKTYLFGGFTNSEFISPRGENAGRSFGDVWQLRLNVPGGCFEGVNLEEEARTARVGPWQRCFTCGDAGPWRKCGGSCKGKAFFCNNECLRDGWKEHKNMHNCAKA